MAQYFWLPFPAPGFWRSPKQEGTGAGSLQSGAAPFSSEFEWWCDYAVQPLQIMDTTPRAGIEPLHVPMSLDLKSSPDPSRNRGGPLAHIRVVTSTPLSMGAVVPEPCLGCPPKNSLGRCAGTLWGPALEQEALAGVPPKKFLGRCARKLWGPAETGSPCRDASQKTL